MHQHRLRRFNRKTPYSINPASAADEVERTWLPVVRLAPRAGETGDAGVSAHPVSLPPSGLLRRRAEGADPPGGSPAPSGLPDVLRRSSSYQTALRRDLKRGVASRAPSADELEVQPAWLPVAALGSPGDPLRRSAAMRSSDQSDPIPAVLRRSVTARSRHPQEPDDWIALVAGAHGRRSSGSSSAISAAPGDSVLRHTGDVADPLGGQRVPVEVMEVLRRSNGHGKRLPADIESGMGRQLGTDLSPVRIHGDQEADVLARSMQATAFTHGRDIYFSRGSFSPESPGGRRLLAHELAHVTAGQGERRRRAAPSSDGRTIRRSGTPTRRPTG